MTFGIKLQKLRKSQGLSQEQLADILSVTRQAVSKWELDETLPDSENVLKIADMFYISAEYLLNNNITEQQGKTMVMSANKYDTVNLIAALAALISSVGAVFYYVLRLISNFTYWYSLPQRDNHICIYGNRVYYEILDETVILVFLTIVITVSAITAYRLYKKCKSQINNQ